jgi:hypothetical protein
MDDRFLYQARREPRPEFAADLSARLRRDEVPAGARARLAFPSRALAAAAAVLAVVALFALPSVRASAQAFLDLFRVRNFAAVEFDPSRLEKLRALNTARGEDSAMLLFDKAEVVKNPGKPETFATPEAASAAAGIEVRTPGTLPAGLALDRVEVRREAEARLRLRTERLRAILDALEVRDLQVPQNLDGQVVAVRMPPVVAMHYDRGDLNATLVQARSPEVTLPQGADLVQLGEIGLRVLGLEPNEARRVARAVDWRSTLIVPVPAGASEFREVRVRGNKGLMITVRDGRGKSGERRRRAETLVLWSEADRVFGLTGNLRDVDLLDMANAIR